MTMEQFAKSVLEQGNPSPLLQALQALRSCDLDQLRDPRNGFFCGDWIPWGTTLPSSPPRPT